MRKVEKIKKGTVDRAIRWGIAFLVVCVVLIGPADGSDAQVDETLQIGLASADLTLVGEDKGDWTAYFASPAGDVNGDGLGDVLVGAPMAGDKVCPYPLNEDGSCPGLPKGQGVAYLVLGRPKGEWLPNPVNLAQADASFLGCEINSMTARQLYTAGDVNGDGYDDILVSGWKCGVNYTGKTYLFLGRPDVGYWGRFFPVAQADASFLGENESDFSSYYTATAGDVNADGYDDILITSTHYDITGTQIITDAGKMYLILGRQEADWGQDYPLSQADASFLGEAEGDRLGRAATGVGDVNGDGYGDFLVGSISSNYGGVDAGQNYLFLGRATQDDPRYDPTRPWWGRDYSVAGADASFVGEAEGDESGRRVAWAGDVNGDGYDDFMIGAALNDQSDLDAGIAHLILGRPAADWGLRYPLAHADASFIGEERRDQAGRRLNGAGDVNNDGYDDFLIGAPHNSRGGFAAGSAYLIYGREAGDWGTYYPLADADIIYVGKPDVGVAGYDMAWLGDFDGDGIDDYLIAAYGGRNNDQVPGEAYVLLGSETPMPIQFVPDAPRNYLGWRRFTGDYQDPNGWQDLSITQLIVGRDITDPMGVNVKYEAGTDALYLYDSDAANWLGPCSPGDDILLSNGVVQLDCRGSTVEGRQTSRLRAMWRVRWLQPISGASELHAYLRGTDLPGNDSGFVGFPWPGDVAIVQSVGPSTMILPGSPLRYRLTFGNAGGVVATGVVITDDLPVELGSVQVDSTLPVTPTGSGPYAWSVGDLAPMQGGVITVTGVVSPELNPGYVFTNTATIAAAELDDERNNVEAVRVIVPFRGFLPVVAK